MIETTKKALGYALTKSEDPVKIKEYMEEYFSMIGLDRRYKLKWRAVACNHKYISTGIFEYYGNAYHFRKIGSELILYYNYMEEE